MEKRPKVIVVEDDVNWLNDICKILQDYFDVEIEPFSSFSKAEERLMSPTSDFDLLISDIFPNPLSRKAEGLTFGAFAKEVINIPVIIVTGDAEGEKIAIRDHDFLCVFEKGTFSKMAFITCVNKVIKKTQRGKNDKANISPLMTHGSQHGQGYALLIGIRYGYAKRPLEGTLKDVNDLYNHFQNREKADYKPQNMILLTEEKATGKAILDALETLAQRARLDPEGTIIIYYSGHAAVNGKESFLVPYDHNEGHVIYSKVFADKLAAIQSKKCLIILDCCHAENIPVGKDLNSSDFLLGDLVEDLNSAFDGSATTKSTSAAIGKGSGRVILTSCEENETSLDLGSNGLFTQVLLECLNGQNNIEKDGWVRLIDMIRYIPNKVKQRALEHYNHNQNPMFKRIDNISSEDFIVCAYDVEKARSVIPQAPAQQLSETQRNNNLEKLFNLIDEGELTRVFSILDSLPIPDKFLFNRLKHEFSAGLKGIELVDFSQRLKVFVGQFKFH